MMIAPMVEMDVKGRKPTTRIGAFEASVEVLRRGDDSVAGRRHNTDTSNDDPAPSFKTSKPAFNRR
jgi:hypothetical protein